MLCNDVLSMREMKTCAVISLQQHFVIYGERVERRKEEKEIRAKERKGIKRKREMKKGVMKNEVIKGKG